MLIINVSPLDYHDFSGGYKEAAAAIRGDDVYGSLKHENGVHRVSGERRVRSQVYWLLSAYMMRSDIPNFLVHLVCLYSVTRRSYHKNHSIEAKQPIPPTNFLCMSIHRFFLWQMPSSMAT